MYVSSVSAVTHHLQCNGQREHQPLVVWSKNKTLNVKYRQVLLLYYPRHNELLFIVAKMLPLQQQQPAIIATTDPGRNKKKVYLLKRKEQHNCSIRNAQG